MANVLKPEKRRAVIASLVEGNSIRATVRMTGVAKATVTKLLVDLGGVCADLMDRSMRNLPCKRLEADEIWAFCYAKQKNVPEEKRGTFGFGDVWTFTVIDAETKLIPAFFMGPRDSRSASIFMCDVASRLAGRVQLTTDGHSMYLAAVEDAFGGDIDYAMLVKHYGNEGTSPETRYSPAECTGCEKKPVQGNPDPDLISTSYVERANLSIRMGMRRFTRLTNGFSKKVENMAAAFALWVVHYNFCRRHQTTRITPAMAAKVTDRLWTVDDLVALLVRSEAN